MTAPYSSSRYAFEGTETTETSIVRTGGAVDPAGQAQSRKIVTTANAQWLRPFRCEPWAIWNETTGADVTVTVYGVAVGALPLNSEVWLDAEFQGDASSTLGAIKTTTMANVLATATSVASDSSTWFTSAPSTMPSITGLTGHWDASVTASLTLSGSDVTSIADQSGGGNTMTYVTTRPAYSATGINSRPAIVFNAATSTAMMRSPFPMGTGNTLTVWCVCTAGASGTIDYGRLVGYSAPSQGDNNNANSWVIHRNNTSTTSLMYSRSSSNSATTAITAHPAAHVLILTINSSGLATMYSDGASIMSVTTPGNWISAGALNIGRYGGGGYLWTGPIGELGVATGYSDATAVASLDAYLRTKWGIADVYTPFKLVATLSSPQPGRPGLIHVRPKIGKASATIYLDPKIELTPASAAPSATHKSSRYAYEGTETTETSIVRSGGTAHSRKIVTTANSQWLKPYRAEPYAVWNETVGADVTVTVYGNAATLPLNDEIFMDVEYLNTTHGTIVSTTKANVLATGVSVASDASSWAGGTTAFKLVAVLNSPQPGQPGLINVRVKAAKPSSTYYLDPTPVLT